MSEKLNVYNSNNMKMATVTVEQREQTKGKMGRMFVNTWHEAVASGRREKEYCGTIIPSWRGAPRPVASLAFCAQTVPSSHMRGRARGRAAFSRRRPDVLSDGRRAVRRSASPLAGGRTTKDWLHTSQPIIEMRLCCPADKPFLLCGLLALYCLHQQYFAHDFSQDSDSAVAQVGFMAFALALMSVAAVADAIAEVEVCAHTSHLPLQPPAFLFCSALRMLAGQDVRREPGSKHVTPCPHL
jgi:hypothetical protein